MRTSIPVPIGQEMGQLQLLQLLPELRARVGVRRQHTCLLYKLLQVALPQLLIQLLQLVLLVLRWKRNMNERGKQRAIESSRQSALTH